MIFFDINGTLFDQENAEKLAAIRFFKENMTDLQVNQKEFMAIRDVYHNNFLIYLLKGLSVQERNRMLMRDLFGHHISNETADQKINDFLKLYKQNWIPFYDVIPCLEQLKSNRFNLGIICNGDYDRQVDKLDTLGVKQYFDVITISNRKGLAKPNKHIFLEACNEVNIKPEQTYYIGDNLVYDAIASKNAGMNGIWINRKNRTTYDDLNVIHSLNDLINIIE
ncbi:MAG: HAD family hydrolase [Lysinibacillus sp.]